MQKRRSQVRPSAQSMYDMRSIAGALRHWTTQTRGCAGSMDLLTLGLDGIETDGNWYIVASKDLRALPEKIAQGAPHQ